MAGVDASAMWELVSSLQGLNGNGSGGSTEQATCTRVDNDGTVWVRLLGAETDTPVNGQRLADVVVGDNVTVTIEDGLLSVIGNSSRPSTSASHVEEVVGPVVQKVTEVVSVVADKASIGELQAATARIGELEADHVAVDDLTAVTGRIQSLESDHVSVADFQAEQANIDTLQANTADIDTIRANSAKVQNLTAAQLEADHATVGSLSTTYATIANLNAANGRITNLESTKANISDLEADYITADEIEATYMHANMSNSDVSWIQNGTIKDGAIVSAMINDVSANKLTAGTINGSVINVTNLNADNITTGTINGQRIGEGSLSLSKLDESVYTEAEVNDIVDGLNDRIDGAIETFTGTAVPTLNNSPASSWNTTKLRDEHVGDVYYVVNSQSQQNGYCYRFTKSGSTYSWQLIKDSDVTAALQRISAAEGKITTFDSDISTLKTDTGTLTTRTTNLETRADDVDATLLDKVDVTTFNEVSDTVDAHTQTISQHTTAISNKADSSTVTAVTNRVSKNEQDISGINTTIGELQDTVETKADGSTVSTISNKLNTVSDTVDGHTQAISSVQNTLSTKADSSTVSTLTTKVNTVSDTVDGHTQRLSSVEDTLETKADGSTVSTISTKVNNISDTVDGHTSQLQSVTSTQTSMQSTLDKTVKSSIQLWYSKANTTAPSKPTSQVTSTSTSGGAWRTVVPSYNASYPNYYYCWQYEYVDGTYGWSAVVRDIAMGESQATARTADSNASAAVTTANTASTNASTALTTANTANTNASDAKTAATTASTTASEAKTTAETAASDASTAKTNAASAVTTANSASTTATNAQSTANANIKSSVQLWFTKANSTAPNKPTSVVSTSNANTANAWNLVVPVWNSSYPHYFYCYQQQKGDGTYQWTDVVYDRATSEAQQLANTTSTNLTTLQEDYATYKQTTTENVSSIGTRLTTAEGKITTAETNITQNATNINAKVSKNDVINQINLSTEGVLIDADRVEIDGTAVFNAIKSSTDAAYDAKGSAASLINGGENLVGRFNLNVTYSCSYDYTNGTMTSTTTTNTADSGVFLHLYNGGSYVRAPAKSFGAADVGKVCGWTLEKASDFNVIKLKFNGNKADSDVRWNVSSIPDGTTITLSFYLESLSSDGKGNGGVLRGINLRTGNMLSEWSLAPQDETIGGRNLLTGTDVWVTTFNSYRTGGNGSETIPAGSVVTVSVEVNADNLVWDTTSNTHRIGFETSLTKTGGGSQYFGVWAGNVISESLNVVEVFTGSIHKRISKTFTLLGDFEIGRSVYIHTQGVAQGTVSVGRAKIEYGNRATDWSPSEGDIVKRTQRIYYRWNSATAPAAPTSWVTKGDDGSALWTKMHVSITESYKYIYTCEQYEMADGTLGHTDVLLDNTITVIDGGNIITDSITANKLNASSINASKTLTVGAMTDAAAATILNSNLQVGGRNLFAKSALLKDLNGAVGSWGNPHSTSDDGVVTISATASDKRIYQVPIRGYWSWEPSTEYTVSVDARADSAAYALAFNPFGANVAQSSSFGVTTEWKRYSWTFTSSTSVNTGSFSFYNVSTTTALQLRRPKLEKGNKATDWTPAPEDVDADISDAAQTATNYITTIDANNGIKIANANPSLATTYLQLASNFLDFIRGGVSMLKAWVDETTATAKVRLGCEAVAHIVIDSGSIGMLNGENEIFSLVGSETVHEDASSTTTSDVSTMSVGNGEYGKASLSFERYHYESEVQDSYRNDIELGVDTDNDNINNTYFRLTDVIDTDSSSGTPQGSAKLKANYLTLENDSTDAFYTMQNVMDVLGGGVTLYDNDSASASAAATLSESAANFRRLTIMYRDQDNTYGSVDVWNPNGKRVSLDLTWINGASTQQMYQRVRWVTISGTTISTSKDSGDSKYRTGQVRLGGSYSVTNSDYISIVHVIGYR